MTPIRSRTGVRKGGSTRAPIVKRFRRSSSPVKGPSRTIGNRIKSGGPNTGPKRGNRGAGPNRGRLIVGNPIRTRRIFGPVRTGLRYGKYGGRRRHHHYYRGNYCFPRRYGIGGYYGSYYGYYSPRFRLWSCWFPCFGNRWWCGWWTNDWTSYSGWWFDPFYCAPAINVYRSSTYFVFDDDDFGLGGSFAFGDAGVADTLVVAEEEPDRSSPESLARYYVELGDLYMRTRRYRRAVDAYERAARLLPDDASLQMLIAGARFAIADFDRSAYALRKAYDLDAEIFGADVDLRDAYGSRLDYDKHLRILKSRVGERPYDAQSRSVLAWLLLSSSDFAEAIAQADRLLAQIPGDRLATAIRVEAKLRMAKVEEARRKEADAKKKAGGKVKDS